MMPDPNRTLPGHWYGDPDLHRRLVERVFVNSWQVGPGLQELGSMGDAVPWRLAPGTVDEPVVTVRQADRSLRTMSNVCTHRGALLVDRGCRLHRVRCPYHGRRFSLDGTFEAAPGFDGRPPDADLTALRTTSLGPLVLATLGDLPAWEEVLGAAWERLQPLLDRPMVAAPDRDETYEIDASWMIYVENYLEGFHVPFVHPELAGAIDVRSYTVEVLPRGVLQVATGPESIDLPADHPDHGAGVAAYYLWLFPDLMLNLYPWGLSLNHVQPLGPRRVRVVYRTWISDPSRLGRGAGGDLRTVEEQDQQVIGRVQAGIGARLYRSGTYAPGLEDGVRAFHQWVREAAQDTGSSPPSPR